MLRPGQGTTASMTEQQLERMKAIIAQAVAEAHHNHHHARLSGVRLTVYGDIDGGEVEQLFNQASRGTEAEGAAVTVEHAGSRYICWNCCGLRFESEDGVCPNCGEMALEVPEEISFALREVTVSEEEPPHTTLL